MRIANALRWNGSRWSLPWLGLAGLDHPVPLVIVAAGTIGIPFVLFATNGNFLLVLAMLIAISLVLASIYRLDWGFALFLGVVLMNDMERVAGFWPLTYTFRYFNNFNVNPYLTIKWAVFSPMELHLAFVFGLYGAMVALRRESFSWKRVPALGPLIMLAGVVMLMIVYGLANGGDTTWALWQTRALMTMFIMIILTPQIIRTREHVELLVWMMIAVISFKALQGVERFAEFGLSFKGYATLTNHEDPVFIVNLIMLLAGFVVWRVNHLQRRTLVWMLMPLGLGFFVGNRRASYASFVFTIFAFIALLTKEDRKPFLRIFKWSVVAVFIYLAAFWNSEGTLGNIAQQVKEQVTGETVAGRGTRDAMSDLYRKWEDYNLAVTWRRLPEGTGFGRKYDTPLKWYNFLELTPIMAYTPHNQLYWMVTTLGTQGFFFFLLFFNMFFVESTFRLKDMSDPYLKSVAAMVIVSVINQLVVTYFDMQITWPRNMVYLGVLMGLYSSVSSLDAEKAPGGESSREAAR
jgi:hypothetical protein